MMLPGMASGAGCQSKQEQDKRIDSQVPPYANASLNQSDIDVDHPTPMCHADVAVITITVLSSRTSGPRPPPVLSISMALVRKDDTHNSRRIDCSYPIRGKPLCGRAGTPITTTTTRTEKGRLSSPLADLVRRASPAALRPLSASIPYPNQPPAGAGSGAAAGQPAPRRGGVLSLTLAHACWPHPLRRRQNHGDRILSPDRSILTLVASSSPTSTSIHRCCPCCRQWPLPLPYPKNCLHGKQKQDARASRSKTPEQSKTSLLTSL
eukprot:scaffold77701_cov69-Phaeocystis_antarctica.AAC.2